MTNQQRVSLVYSFKATSFSSKIVYKKNMVLKLTLWFLLAGVSYCHIHEHEVFLHRHTGDLKCYAPPPIRLEGCIEDMSPETRYFFDRTRGCRTYLHSYSLLSCTRHTLNSFDSFELCRSTCQHLLANSGNDNPGYGPDGGKVPAPPSGNRPIFSGDSTCNSATYEEVNGASCNGGGSPMTMYQYNVQTGSCESFVYTNCRAVRNMYPSAEVCQRSCIQRDGNGGGAGGSGSGGVGGGANGGNPLPPSCDPGVQVFQCLASPCDVTSCAGYPGAQCRANYCGGCNADYYVGNEKVNCNANGGPGGLPAPIGSGTGNPPSNGGAVGNGGFIGGPGNPGGIPVPTPGNMGPGGSGNGAGVGGGSGNGVGSGGSSAGGTGNGGSSAGGMGNGGVGVGGSGGAAGSSGYGSGHYHGDFYHHHHVLDIHHHHYPEYVHPHRRPVAFINADGSLPSYGPIQTASESNPDIEAAKAKITLLQQPWPLNFTCPADKPLQGECNVNPCKLALCNSFPDSQCRP